MVARRTCNIPARESNASVTSTGRFRLFFMLVLIVAVATLPLLSKENWRKETMGAPVHCACSSRYVVLASCSVLPGPILSCSATTTSKMGMRSFYYQKMLNRERTFFVLCLRGWYANAYELSDLDVICHKAKSRYIGSVITSMSPKNSPVRAHHWRPISIVRTMAKDNPNATNVHITAIACFVLIENSTILTSSALKYPC